MSVGALLAISDPCHAMSLAETRPRNIAVVFILVLLLDFSVRCQQENEVLMPEDKILCFAKTNRTIGREPIPLLQKRLRATAWFIQWEGWGSCGEALFQGALHSFRFFHFVLSTKGTHPSFKQINCNLPRHKTTLTLSQRSFDIWQWWVHAAHMARSRWSCRIISE